MDSGFDSGMALLVGVKGSHFVKQVGTDLEVAVLSIDGLADYSVAPVGVVPVVAAQHYYSQPAGPRVVRPVVVELPVTSFHPNILGHKKALGLAFVLSL